MPSTPAALLADGELDAPILGRQFWVARRADRTSARLNNAAPNCSHRSQRAFQTADRSSWRRLSRRFAEPRAAKRSVELSPRRYSRYFMASCGERRGRRCWPDARLRTARRRLCALAAVPGWSTTTAYHRELVAPEACLTTELRLPLSTFASCSFKQRKG